MNDDLYQEVILEHNREPRNFHKLEDSIVKEGFNPLCGDHIFVYVKIIDDKISDISFLGEGCAICKASTSMMTEAVKGKSVSDAKRLFEDFHGLLTKGESKDLGKLSIFLGVRQYPVRIKCASLPWHTLKAALEDKEEIVKTE